MPRSLIIAVAFVSSACAAILPDRLGDYQRKSVSPVASGDKSAEFNEDGLEAAETDDYGAFQVTVARFKDVTGAYAAALGALVFRRVGNYLVDCNCPKSVEHLVDSSLPNVSQGSTPTLGAYFPPTGLIPRSKRYILGPEGLRGYLIPASVVDFDLGTEGEIAQYRSPSGTLILAVFEFPTPSLARQQLPQFEKITGATAKRTGPLIAVSIGSPAASAKLLSGIDYQAVVAMNEKPPDKPLELKPESAGKMVLSIFSLAGLLLVFCLLSGLAVGGILRLARKFGYSAAEGSMTTLHLEGK
jgi:hypothetical protein